MARPRGESWLMRHSGGSEALATATASPCRCMTSMAACTGSATMRSRLRMRSPRMTSPERFPAHSDVAYNENVTPIVIGVAADTVPTLRGGYSVGTSGRRSIGYTHNGDAALAQMVTLQLRVPGTLGVVDDPRTTTGDDADEAEDSVATSKRDDRRWPTPRSIGRTVDWFTTTHWEGLPILLGDAASNEIIVDAGGEDPIDDDAYSRCLSLWG